MADKSTSLQAAERISSPSIHDAAEPKSPHAAAGLWKPSKISDGDTAQALFEHSEQHCEPIDPAAEARLLRKIDLVILPCLVVCYAFYYIDKTTLSYAAIFGIKDDLKLEGTDYSWLSSVFYFGWLLWAFPTNYLLQRFPVAKYLALNIFLWGALLMAEAGTTNFATLAVVRFLSGAAEGVSDSAFMLITTMWYTRREQPIRIGIWYSANGIGNSMGGLLGYAIGHIKGHLASWKYEFLIIGALCAIWGIVLFICLPDSPVTAKFLSLEEKRMAVERLRGNQTGVENKHFKFYQVREAFADYKTYMFFAIAFVANIPNGGISNFGTLIIKGFGYSTLVTTLFSIPYGAIIMLSILSCVFINDRLPANHRSIMAALYLLPSILGAFGLRYLSHDLKVGRLCMYYLTGFYQASFVLVLSLFMANTAGHTKKVTTSACIFLGMCGGNIAGPFFYKTEQAPGYQMGITSMISTYVLELVGVLVLRELLRRDNRRSDRVQGVTSGEVLESVRELGETAFMDLTDRENPNFRYVY